MYLTSRLRAPGSGSALTVIVAAVSVLISTVILAAPVRADGLLPDSTNWDRTPLPRYAVVGAVTPTNASANAVDRAECRVPGERGRLFQRTRTTWYYPALGAWRAADCTVTPSQGGNIGLTFGLKALAVMAIGGMGDMRGAVVAGLAIGVLEALLFHWGWGRMGELAVWAAMLATLVLRPGGLFAGSHHGREVRV